VACFTPPAVRPRIAAGVAFVAALYPVAVAPAAPPPTQSRQQPQPLIIRVTDDGFHWGDAGIGAAAGFGVALVLSGGFVLTGQRDLARRHPAQHKERKR
jgi:hypothetical protein